jgi:hypothetical protein
VIEKWKGADLEKLKTMHAAGASASVIAKALGRSRNSICSKFKILGLHREKPVGDEREPIKKTKSLTPKPPAPRALSLVRTNKPALIDSRPVGIVHSGEDQCRAILDTRGPDGLVMFCGAPVTYRGLCTSSFCETHHQLFHKKASV